MCRYHGRGVEGEGSRIFYTMKHEDFEVISQSREFIDQFERLVGNVGPNILSYIEDPLFVEAYDNRGF